MRSSRGLRALLAVLALAGTLRADASSADAAPFPAASVPATPATISPAGMLAYEVSLAAWDDRLALAWHGSVEGRSVVWLRFADAHGEPVGDAWPLTDGQRDAYEPDLQALGRGLVVAWYEKQPDTGALSAWLAALDARGQVLWRRALSAAGHDGRNPVVRVARGELAVAWIDTVTADARPEVWTARYTADGREAGAPRRVAAASPTTWNLNAAVDDSGRLYVVYDAALDGRASEVQWARIARRRIDTGALTADDGIASTYPDIAIEGGRVAVSWAESRDGHGEIELFTGALSSLPRNLTPLARRVTHAAGPAFGADLAWNRHGLELAWDEGGGNGDAVEIHAQRFAADGRALGAAQTLTHAGLQSLIPSVRRWRGGFAVAWNEYRADPADAIHGRPLSSVARLLPLP